MEVTRDVITDLLPAYLAGEASAETRALVEAFLKSDPEYARRVEAEWSQNLTLLQAIPAAVAPDREKEALDRTKTLLKVRSLSLMIAILFTLFPLSVTYTPSEGVRWLLWQPGVPFWGAVGITAVCVINAALGWGVFIWINRRGAAAAFDWVAPNRGVSGPAT